MRRALLAIAVLLALAATARAADFEVSPDGPPAHIHTPATCATDGGSVVRLPPGYLVPEQAWSKLDLELRRLQDVETRLSAENASLRLSARSGGTGWLWGLAAGVVAGVVAGAVIF